jgi:hypothetical protein
MAAAGGGAARTATAKRPAAAPAGGRAKAAATGAARRRVAQPKGKKGQAAAGAADAAAADGGADEDSAPTDEEDDGGDAKKPWQRPLPRGEANPMLRTEDAQRILIRLYRPPPPATPKPEAKPPKEYAALSLSQAAVRQALGTTKFQQLADKEGRSLWSAARLEDEKLNCATMDPEADEHCDLQRAVTTQEQTLETHAVGKQIDACLEQAAANPATAGVHLLDALACALDGAEAAFALWNHPGRLAALQEAKRRRNRLLDRAVHEAVTFAAERQPPPPPPPTKPPTKPPDKAPDKAPPDKESDQPPDKAPVALERWVVILIGAWVLDKQRAGLFPKKEFIRRLSKRAICIITSEHNSTARCGVCSAENAYPKKMDGRKHNGTVYCSNPHCPAGGTFLNRDVAAASTLVNCFTNSFYLGGRVGVFEKSVVDHAPATPISLFGTLTAPRRPEAATAAGSW